MCSSGVVKQNKLYFTSSNRYYANVTFADIHKVDGMRGIYIASQVVNGTFDVNNQRSLITFDKGGEWRLLRAPDYDSAGRPTNCSVVSSLKHCV